MAWTQTDLESLEAAYAGGTLSVRFADGRQVTYPSAQDLLSRIQTVRAALASAAGSTVSSMGRFTSFERD